MNTGFKYKARAVYRTTRPYAAMRLSLGLAATIVSTLAAGLVGWSPALGADPAVRWSGFGTLGYVTTDSPDVVYRNVAAGDGADGHGSLEVDSRLGVQANATLSPLFSAVVQVLAREDADGDFTPGLEWAFARAQMTPTLGVRIGRIGAPMFMVSDFREVGYANTLMRPPEDTYAQVPIRTFDGADVIGQFELGETLLNVQAFIGSAEAKFPLGRRIDFKDLAGVNLTLERGAIRLRLGHVTTRLGTHFPDLLPFSQALEAASQQVPSLQAVAKDFTDQSRRGGFSGIGLELDLDPWFVSGEFTQRRIRDSFAADTTGWYLAAGYRWNEFTPYASISALRQDSRKRSLPFPPIPQLAPLEAAATAAYRSSDQNTVALGLRWDPLENVAVKAQLEHVERDVAGESFDNLSPTENGRHVRLASFGIDFVF